MPRSSALDRKDGRWTIGLRDGETIAATNIVNAAGAWADVVGGARRRASRSAWCPSGAPPSPSMRRRASSSRSLPMVIDFDESFYFKPEVGQFLASPADETPSPPCDAQPEEIDIAIAVDRIETATTLQIRAHQEQMGGPAQLRRRQEPGRRLRPRGRGFFWLAGQGGYGIQTGAAAGRLAASLALGKGLPGDIVALGVTETALSPAALHAGVIGNHAAPAASVTSRLRWVGASWRSLGITGVAMGKFTLLAASAAALFAAGARSTARAEETVKCSGVNSCKGTSSCKTALVFLQGQELLQGHGLDHDVERQGMHGQGRQGPLTACCSPSDRHSTIFVAAKFAAHCKSVESPTLHVTLTVGEDASVCDTVGVTPLCSCAAVE